jgi:hypothetical protein
MGDFTLSTLILVVCVALAAYEIVMANRHKKEGADAVDWKRARGIVWIGAVLAVLAWFVQYMMG